MRNNQSVRSDDCFEFEVLLSASADEAMSGIRRIWMAAAIAAAVQGSPHYDELILMSKTVSGGGGGPSLLRIDPLEH